jgi:hypothetical protein
MIVTLFLNSIAFLLNGIISFFPLGTIPTQWVSAVYQIWAYGNSFSYVFPVSAILFWLGIVLAFNAAVLGFKLFSWIIRKVPGIS